MLDSIHYREHNKNTCTPPDNITGMLGGVCASASLEQNNECGCPYYFLS